jgi:subtilisin-like proprotein convertase family protein
MTAIFNAFNRHGIACTTPTAVNSGCSAGPRGAATLSTTAGDNSASLSWSAVSGASSYWVLRTEGHAGCDFGKAKIAQVTGTTYTDAAVANGRQYSYNVVAQGASAACYGPVSNCSQVTPTASSTPDFSVACSPSSVSVQQGSSSNTTCTVTSINGFSSAVTLSCGTLPAGVSCGFAPVTVTPTANSTLTFTASGSATTGTSSVTVTGTSGATTRTASVSLTVTSAPVPNFSVACSPSSLNANQGASATSTCTVTSTGGFASSVALSCTGLPAGATCAFVPASVTPPANGSINSALTVSVSGSATPGTYAFNAQGVSGALTRTGALSLTINPPAGSNQVLSFSASPALAIPDNNTTGVTSTINVPNSMTITSVKVQVGITHTYQGDLEVALIGPDNTTVLLHNRTGAGTDNINTTYNITTRSNQALTAFNGKNTSGAWKLRVRDLASADTGTLNTWKVTFNGYSTQAPALSIPDNNTTGVTATINVAASGTVTSIRVRVGITHTYQGDLEVALIGPDNTTVLLHNRTGAGTDNINTVYPDLTAPAQALSAFNGKAILGAWKLRVRDLASADTGTLNTWEIDFN